MWVPAAVWFAGWALSSIPEGMDHFTRVFIGTGYCGDFACAGQWFVTSPLVGSLSYVTGCAGEAIDPALIHEAAIETRFVRMPVSLSCRLRTTFHGD